MKTIGLIGGMSWESTVTYYQVINERVKNQLGGLHSAKIVLYSVDFFELEAYMTKGEWGRICDILTDAARRLVAAGADFIVVCTNTMHKVAPQVAEAAGIPLLHIAEATARDLKQNSVSKVLLLGTKYTMTQSFIKDKLVEAGIEVVIPNPQEIEVINNIIFKELCVGVINPESKATYQKIIGNYSDVQGVIFGCTEIGLLLQQEDVTIPVFDTTYIHAEQAAELALEDAWLM